MAISELQNQLCPACDKKGFTSRIKAEEETLITENNTFIQREVWYCKCNYCGEVLKIVYSQEGV